MRLSFIVLSSLSCLAQIGTKQTVTAAGTKFSDSLLTNLANTFTSKTEGFAYLFKRHLGLIVDAETAFYDLFLALVEYTQSTVNLC